jgi:hypothetical protein
VTEALEGRAGLPEALRVLLAQYPRAGWQGHARFDGLTRFWLERHLGFRQVQAGLVAELRGLIDGRVDPEGHGRRVWRRAAALVEGLEGHHQIEDAHYFPHLAGLEPRLARGFALLDADHQALDGHLAALVVATNAHLGALGAGGDGRTSAGALLARLEGFGGFLERHLIDEEDLVVPVILHHGVE